MDSLDYWFMDPEYFACANGHIVCAYVKDSGRPVDLALHVCPVCLGKIGNPADAFNFSNVLSPIQSDEQRREEDPFSN